MRARGRISRLVLDEYHLQSNTFLPPVDWKIEKIGRSETFNGLWKQFFVSGNSTFTKLFSVSHRSSLYSLKVVHHVKCGLEGVGGQGDSP